MDFVVGFLSGAVVMAILYYKFYHIKVVNDLKNIINELQAKVK